MYGGRVVEEGVTEQIYTTRSIPTRWACSGPPTLADDGTAPLRTIEGLPPSSSTRRVPAPSPTAAHSS